MDTLSIIEKVEVDNKDRPIEDIVITMAHVFVDPFAEADQEVSRGSLLCGWGVEVVKEEAGRLHGRGVY